jgi:hypothetical protein
MWWLLWLGCASSPPSPFDDGDGDAVIALDDCDDADPAIHPGALERCDPPGSDENCDGWAEDPHAIGVVEGWHDGDRDGWGTYDVVSRCDATAVADRSGDCDDARPDVFPGAPEVCDAAQVDEDCDGLLVWYGDSDGDGWGAGLPQDCARAALYGGDCDDADAAVSPGAPEICGNRTDDDCDANALPCAWQGTITPADATGWVDGFPAASGDLDGDGAPDVVTIGTGGGRLEIYAGPVLPGEGPVSTWLAPSGEAWKGAILADLDGDGALDLAAATERGLVADFAPPGGDTVRWEAAEQIFAVEDAGDTDGDGRSELLVRAEGVSWVVQGRLTAGALADIAHVEVPADAAPVGDVDGDGLADLGLLSAPEPCVFSVLLAPLSPVVRPAEDAVACRLRDHARAVSVASVGDVDGDGFAEIALGFEVSTRDDFGTTRSGSVLLLRGGQLGEGPFSGERELVGHAALPIGDLDGDGFADLLVHDRGERWSEGHTAASTTLYLSSTSPRATFWPGPTSAGALGDTALPAADYDGDGTIDLVVGDGGRTWWFSANGEAW